MGGFSPVIFATWQTCGQMAIMTTVMDISAKPQRISRRRKSKPPEVVLIALAGGHASTAVGPLEVFNAAGVTWQELTGDPVQPRFSIRTVSLDGRATRMGDGVSLKLDHALNEISSADLIFISSGGPDIDALLENNGRVVDFVRRRYRSGASVAAVCSGVAILAEAGVLDGVQATTHWSLIPEFARRYPRTSWKGRAMVTEGKRVYCGGGVYAALDLAIHLVEVFADRKTAVECAKALLVEMPRSSQPEFGAVAKRALSVDKRIAKAQQMIQRSFSLGVVLEDVAREVGMSPRNFIRRFKQSTGSSPMAYLQGLRIDLAKRLIEQGWCNTQEVAAHIGYSDVTHFRGIFKRVCGVSPSEYKRSVGQSRRGRAPGLTSSLN